MQLLFIAFHFPPQGGAGVQRALKFVKYLPEFGIMPTILTTDHIPKSRWTPPDKTLTEEVPPQIKVIRTAWPVTRKCLDRCVADSLIQNQLSSLGPFDFLLVSASPFSDISLAQYLSNKLKIPWFADLRDPWALDEFQVRLTRWHRVLLKRKMGKSLSGALRIIMNTPEASCVAREAFPNFEKDKIFHVTNGFDGTEFKQNQNKKQSNVFKIVHSGSLQTHLGLQQKKRKLEYAILGRTIKGMRSLSRSHFYLLAAIKHMCEKRPNLRQEIKLVLAGLLHQTDFEIIRQFDLSDVVETPGYLTHGESINLISGADLLFLPMHTLVNGERATIVPGKTYEYMATGRPILAAVPDGDAKDFLKQCGTAFISDPDDVESITRILLKRYSSWKNNTPNPPANWKFIRQFERKNLAGKLADILKGCDNRSHVAP